MLMIGYAGTSVSSRHLPRALALAALGMAVLLLVVSYAVIAVKAGEVFPWQAVVHEDGQRTLLETIFYFEHAARELPVDLVLGVAIGGCVLLAWPPAPAAVTRTRHLTWPLTAAVVAVVGLIVAGSVVEVGWHGLWDNLLQKHSRPGWPLAWGAHWRYHLGARLALILAAMGVAGALAMLVPVASRDEARAGERTVMAVLGVYLLLTVLFSESPAALWSTFRDPVPLGHQARELLTHGSVTLPAAWTVCLLLACRMRPARTAVGVPAPRFLRWWLAAGALGVGMGLALVLAAASAGAISHGQTGDLAMLIFPHYFEHTLSYVLVPLVACATYTVMAGRNGAGGGRLVSG